MYWFFLKERYGNFEKNYLCLDMKNLPLFYRNYAITQVCQITLISAIVHYGGL